MQQTKWEFKIPLNSRTKMCPSAAFRLLSFLCGTRGQGVSEKKMEMGMRLERKKRRLWQRETQPEYTNANPSFSLSSVSKYLIKLNVMRSFTIYGLTEGARSWLQNDERIFWSCRPSMSREAEESKGEKIWKIRW